MNARIVLSANKLFGKLVIGNKDETEMFDTKLKIIDAITKAVNEGKITKSEENFELLKRQLEEATDIPMSKTALLTALTSGNQVSPILLTHYFTA